MPTYGQQCPGQIDCIDPFCSLVPGLINFLLVVMTENCVKKSSFFRSEPLARN